MYSADDADENDVIHLHSPGEEDEHAAVMFSYRV